MSKNEYLGRIINIEENLLFIKHLILNELNDNKKCKTDSINYDKKDRTDDIKEFSYGKD